MPRGLCRRALPWIIVWAACAPATSAHEIPTDVTVRIIVKPLPGRLEMLVRVPLEAMQDINFPTTGTGFLDFDAADASLRNAGALWLANDIDVYENGRPLGAPRLVVARASIPSDRSFGDWESAREHVMSPPLPSGTQLVWRQALLDVLFELPIDDAQSDFAIQAGLERLGLAVVTVIRFEPPTGTPRTFRIAGGSERVELDPRWHQAAWRFVVQGFEHILDGTDHLLFLLCLVMPFRRNLHALVLVVTAFTVAHSITLIGSAFGLAPGTLWFTPLVETVIAASIFYMAVENVVAAEARMRWLVAFVFGLVHGFGFSFALRDTMQFAGDHLLTSLLSFNVGVELGQLFVLVIMVPILNLVFRYVVNERVGIVVTSVIVGHVAWHWMSDRFAILREFPVGVAGL